MPVIRLIAFWLTLGSPLAWGHGMSPQRFEVDSGTEAVIASLTIINNYNFQDRFSVVCLKGAHTEIKVDCESIPHMVILSPHAKRKIKVRMPTTGDGVYRICSIEEPDESENKAIITRVCALIGVGVSPTADDGTGKRPKHRPASNAMATRPGSGPVR